MVGVSRSDANHPPGYTGLRFLRLLKSAGFRGRVYPVNPKADSIEGTKVYPRLGAIPEPLDLVIVAVPAAIVPQVLEECVALGTTDVHLCSAGFGETGQPQTKSLEARVREIALKGGLRVVGPNCLGYHVPSARLQMYEMAVMTPGPVAFVSQSGGHGERYSTLGPAWGIGFSKIISYGNALMMDCTDFLEYLAADPETRVICMYLEGVKNGRKLIDLMRRTSPEKPIIVWKGGLTSTGARAAATHTGSLAGDRQVWEALFKQTGAMRVGSVEEMADVTMTVQRLKPTSGARLAVVGGGGGNNVATGDVCAEEGVEVPALSEETKRKLMTFVTLVNQSLVNPLDAGSIFEDAGNLRRALETVAADPSIDIIVLHMGAGFAKWFGPELMAKLRKCIVDFGRDNAWGKQVVVAAAQHEASPGDTDEFVRDLRGSGIITYSSLRAACRSLRRFADYHRFLAQRRGDAEASRN
ncbi:MAG: CoA-binding protein [Chloroflexi bacterium]|nr:CoA-binding protein [Chloroflexota bacterium]